LEQGGLFSFVNVSQDVSADGSGSGKVTFYNGYNLGAAVLYFNLDFSKDIYGNQDTTPIYNKIGYILGYTQCLYQACVSYTSESPVQMNRSYFYLSIDDYINNTNSGFITLAVDSMSNKNILAKISLNNETTTVMKEDFDLISQTREYFGPVDIQNMHIRLYDNFGKIVNLNGRDFSFSLSFKTLYDL
jgi:hypothetical protein